MEPSQPTPPNESPAFAWGPEAKPSVGMPRGFNFMDFILFRQMITPAIVAVVYVIGALLITLGSIAQLGQPLVAIGGFVVAQLFLRVFLEVFMVFFGINGNLSEINRRGRGM